MAYNRTDLSVGHGYCKRAPFASHPELSRGRFFQQAPCPLRTEFQRDRDKILHSSAFRRLQGKTQVFITTEGDHYRTRLTHSLEVAQIARSLARVFRLDEELAEAIAIAHDLGHTAFGHTGEDALNELMQPYGGFDHNAQALRIVTSLENHYSHFSGLNLTWESLEGIVKHNGPLLINNNSLAELPETITVFNAQFDLALDKFAGLEAQCAAIADDIAYNGHDIDDALYSNLLKLEALEDIPLTAELLKQIKEEQKSLTPVQYGYELVRRQIRVMINDVIEETERRLKKLNPSCVEDIYNAPFSVVAFSSEMLKKVQELKRFLFNNVYRHPALQQKRKKATALIGCLFQAYRADRRLLPLEWQKKSEGLDDAAYARLVADFISGMTDLYAIKQAGKFYNMLAEELLPNPIV